jgi:type I restriction enzyme M protein
MTDTNLQNRFRELAGILEGTLDPAEARPCVLGLLLLRRLNDQFKVRARALQAQTDDASVWEDPDEYPIFVPADARWERITGTAEHIGAVLNRACEALEECCPHNTRHLGGVLRTLDFNTDKLGDALLERLLKKLDICLGDANLQTPNSFGHAFTWLLNYYGEQEGKDAAKSSTPPAVNRLLVRLSDLQEGMSVCDPASGFAGTLIDCASWFREFGRNERSLSLYGQEVSHGNHSIARMALVAHEVWDATTSRADTLRSPAFLNGGTLQTFDRILSHPEFSRPNWGHDDAAADGFRRFVPVLPPRQYGDLAFVQHALATLTNEGRAVLVMPHGVLFRGGSEAEIRRKLLKEDLLEAAIGLPFYLFYGTNIPAAILVMSRAKPPERTGKVLFINASQEFEEGKAQNYLREQDVQKIATTFHSFKDMERYARVVSVEELERNDVNLSIHLYVDIVEEQQAVDVREAVQELRKRKVERNAAEEKMNALLKELGYGA